MRRINAMVFIALTRVSIAVTLLTAWVLFFVKGDKASLYAIAAYSKWMRAMLKFFCGVEIRAEGLEKIPAGPCIFACKHQAEIDPFTFPELVHFDTAFIMKKELFDIPLWGMYARRAGSVPIDRSAGASALRTLVRDVDRALKQGQSVVIYPEGTRTEAGAKDVRYHPGIAALYKNLDAPVVPVASNTGQFFPRGGKAKPPGVTVIKVLDPVERGLDNKAFMTRLHDVIETESLKLYEDAGGAGGKGAGAA